MKQNSNFCFLLVNYLGYNLSSDFKKHFCILFNIEDLANHIQTKVTVENEQPAINLSGFYRQAIDLIQDFLLANSFISDIRSNHLATIFARMQFFCVDHIQVSYSYGSDIIKTPSNLHSIDTYIDQQECKFYILKKYENSEMRYTDAMAEFIVKDDVARSKLLTYIRKLLQMYQNDADHGLDKAHENLQRNHEPKWSILELANKEVSVPLKEEKVVVVAEKPVITDEQIAQLSSEPTRRPKPRAKEATNEEGPSQLTSFPLKAGAMELKDPSTLKTTPKPSAENSTKEKSADTPELDDRQSRTSDEHRAKQAKGDKHPDGKLKISYLTEKLIVTIIYFS